MIEVRDPLADDQAAWRQLWEGYVIFQEAVLPEEITVATWRRILDPTSPIFARMAVLNGAVIGFAVSVLHEGSWVTAPICYLEDLFVAAPARGLGAGRALIDDLLAMSRAKGWSRLYWNTRTGNPARRLYDRFVLAEDTVRYRLDITGR